jgi:hypothetical protein
MIFSEMFDEFESAAATIFSTHQELDDNILIENNSELKLKLGFCLEWKDVQNTERHLNGFSAKQTCVVTNTLANDGFDNDVATRKLATKTILQNCSNLIEWVEENPHLNAKAASIKFLDHPGPEQIFDENKKAYLMIQATYTLEWF